jgi:hypothetical protein
MNLHLMISFGFVFAANAAAQDRLPADVARFVERRDGCDHFRGEEPYDDERRRFLEQRIRKLCIGTDRTLANLKKKYRDDRPVMDRLNAYEPKIEISSGK